MGKKLVNNTNKDESIKEKKDVLCGLSITVWIILLTVVGCGLVIWLGISHVNKNIPKREFKQLIDWDSLEASPSENEAKDNDKVEGVIEFEDYFSTRKADARESISKISGLLETDVHENLLVGVESQYFADSCAYDYIDMTYEIDQLLTEATYINSLYDAYKRESGIEYVEICIGQKDGEKCSLYKYIIKYTSGELKNYLLETHAKWESLVKNAMDKTEVTDSYLNLFYQDSICDNYDYLEDIEVDVATVTNSELDYGIDVLNQNKKKLHSKKLSKIELDYLKQLELYKDLDFYDEDFQKIAGDTMVKLFADKVVIDNSTYIGRDLNINSATLSDAIKNIDVPDKEVEYAKEDPENLENWLVREYSLTGRNTEDCIYILFKVKKAKHVDNIPTLEETKDELTYRAKAYMAQLDISDVIYAEINDIEVPEDGEADTHGENDILREYMGK